MHRLSLFSEGDGVRKILALGAHADDIEIGCGGTLLRLLSERSDLEVTWVVFCSTSERAREAKWRESTMANTATAVRPTAVLKSRVAEAVA